MCRNDGRYRIDELEVLYNYVNVKIKEENRDEFKVVLSLLLQGEKWNLNFITGLSSRNPSRVISSLVKGGYGHIVGEMFFEWLDMEGLLDKARKLYYDEIDVF